MKGLRLSLTNNLSLTGSSPDIVRVGAVRATGTASGGTGTVDISSLSLQQGDLLLVGMASRATADLDASVAGNNSSTFTEIADLYANSTNHDCNLYVGRQIVGATPDTSLTVSPGALTTEYAVHVLQYRNVNGTPLDVAAQTSTATDSDQPNPPAITPSTAGARIVVFYASATGTSTAWNVPSDVDNFIQDASAATNTGRIGSADKVWTSGEFDPAALTGGQGASTARSRASVTLALRPA